MTISEPALHNVRTNCMPFQSKLIAYILITTHWTYSTSMIDCVLDVVAIPELHITKHLVGTVHLFVASSQ